MKTKIAMVFLTYLRFFARLQLAKVKFLQQLFQRKLTIIGITGSAGKTTVMLAIQAVLQNHFKVKTNYGGNSETGIPLSILDLKMDNFSLSNWIKIALLSPIQLLINWKTYDIFVVEMGIDAPTEPKNMSYLLKIVQPSIGVFLNVNSVHSQNFDHLIDIKITGQNRQDAITKQIALEKSRLINSLNSQNIAIINLDDPYVVSTTQTTLAKKLTFGHDPSASLKIVSTHTGPQGFKAIFRYQNTSYNLVFPDYAFPEIYSSSFAAAFLVGISQNLDPKQILNDIKKNFHNPPSRASIFPGINDSTIIDSSYNSSPAPTAQMLKLLSTFPSKRIAVLGDMRELGQQSQIEHKRLFKIASQSADIVIGIGPETQKYFLKNPHNFQFWWQAEKFLKNYLKDNPKSTLLVKGSQNTIFLEELIKSILSNPSDQQLLCRQSPYWLTLKQKFRQLNQ